MSSNTAIENRSAEPERITGEDALFLNLERPDTPGHTLKVVVLDTALRGEPVTLADLHRVIPGYLGLTPRSTQRVGHLPGRPRALAWVADENFDLANHLDEVQASAPGDRAALDRVCEGLAVTQLDRSRPLWSMTLVHGLAGGQQAVVVRVHHAIADGLATINLLRAATTEAPGTTVPQAPAGTTVSVAGPTAQGTAGALLKAARASRRRTRDFGSRVEVPGRLVARNSFNARSGADRLCVSGSLDLADLKTLAKSTGVTLNGALHAVIAGAMRDELVARGERPDAPLVATFGVVEDGGPERLHGNAIATARAFLRADIADPIARLHETARSCLLSVGLRRARGFDLHREGSQLAQRLFPVARALFADITPGVTNHITTANVPGPATSRWFGDVEVVDWISFSLAVAPADVNLTAYSYDGRLTIGLVVTPESMPDPWAFLRRVEQNLAGLLGALQTTDVRVAAS